MDAFLELVNFGEVTKPTSPYKHYVLGDTHAFFWEVMSKRKKMMEELYTQQGRNYYTFIPNTHGLFYVNPHRPFWADYNNDGSVKLERRQFQPYDLLEKHWMLEAMFKKRGHIARPYLTLKTVEPVLNGGGADIGLRLSELPTWHLGDISRS